MPNEHRGKTPQLRADGGMRANRAAQFMPFAALRGYYELIRKQELALSQVMLRVRRGQMVRVVYYDEDAYVTLTGCVARVDIVERELMVVKTKIPLDSIRSLEIVQA